MTVTMRIAATLLVIAAVWGGKYAVSLIFRAAGVRAGGNTGLLRGGLWIGYLERLGIVTAILTSYPAGIAVILGVKTLARYAELSRNRLRDRTRRRPTRSRVQLSSNSSSERWHQLYGRYCSR